MLDGATLALTLAPIAVGHRSAPSTPHVPMPDCMYLAFLLAIRTRDHITTGAERLHVALALQ